MTYSERAQSFYDDAMDRYEWSRDEKELLHEIARTITQIDIIESALEDEPPFVTGSTKQVRIHPGVEEARAQRALLARLLKDLGIAAIDKEEADKEEAAKPHAVTPHRWNTDTARAAGRASGRARR